MQQTQVRSLIWEDATRHATADPAAPHLMSLGSRPWEPLLLSPGAGILEAHTPQREKPQQ